MLVHQSRALIGPCRKSSTVRPQWVALCLDETFSTRSGTDWDVKSLEVYLFIMLVICVRGKDSIIV